MKFKNLSAPHLRTKDTTRQVMIDVLISLTPAIAVSTWVFGLRALYIMMFSMISAEVLDFFIVRVLKKQKNYKPDFSASVTGLLFGMNMSMAVHWWHMLIGIAFAIIVAKHAFGGLGQNIFNPAEIGRVFMLISFPTVMTTWYKPFANMSASVDTITTATPLALLKEYGANKSLSNFSYMDMFLGKIPGSIGEVSALALLIGFAYLVYKKRIKLMIPISIFSTVLIISSIFYFVNPTRFGTPLFHLLAGGMIIGALFMATDMVTSPMTIKGQIVFGIGIGVIALTIRYFGAYPEGVSFSIVIMNALVPLIDLWMKPRVFGTSKKGAK
ncbi:electron transport complex subunit D [Tepiditoga spiralis]|uniref:Ion-translocating oxidoreductase complex subunit D n=1 Tax=Tepiditoga spiralis TaxID=2108365 RepID=A0A7G1G8T4_9BACT|nr:RnfABCDGE type electron transport complex subunit D [Tepiditoga spiralis]BBE31654.1 electron transport complex subunit D [Tepiditoga spiralis]